MKTLRVILPVFVLPAMLFALPACAPTEGREVSFAMRLETQWPVPATPGTFTTATGWTVSLDAAWLVAGPIYLFEKPPVGLALRQRSLFENGLRTGLETGLDWLIPRALAHPGDVTFAGGTVYGEFVEQRLFDVLGAPVTIDGLTGTAARVRSYTLILYPPRAGLLVDGDPTQGAQLAVAGTATKDATTVRFKGRLEIANEGRLRYVEGIGADAVLEEGGTFVVQVKPGAWFDQADFASLTTEEPSGTFVIDRNSQVWGAWFIGARSAAAYASEWVPSP